MKIAHGFQKKGSTWHNGKKKINAVLKPFVTDIVYLHYGGKDHQNITVPKANSDDASFVLKQLKTLKALSLHSQEVERALEK